MTEVEDPADEERVYSPDDFVIHFDDDSFHLQHESILNEETNPSSEEARPQEMNQVTGELSGVGNRDASTSATIAITTLRIEEPTCLPEPSTYSSNPVPISQPLENYSSTDDEMDTSKFSASEGLYQSSNLGNSGRKNALLSGRSIKKSKRLKRAMAEDAVENMSLREIAVKGLNMELLLI